MFTTLRGQLIERVQESRQILSLIRRLESNLPLARDEREVVILRGMFYVCLYSVLEFTMQHVVQDAFQFISDKHVPLKCLSNSFYSVALDGEFKSNRDVAEKKIIKKRLELLDKQSSNEVRLINSDLFSMYLQNIDLDTIQLVFKCFCIAEEFSSVSGELLYVSEIKNKRNMIVHGRESAYFVGQSTRSIDLEIRFNAIQTITNFIIDRFEISLQNRDYIAPVFKSSYD